MEPEPEPGETDSVVVPVSPEQRAAQAEELIAMEEAAKQKILTKKAKETGKHGRTKTAKPQLDQSPPAPAPVPVVFVEVEDILTNTTITADCNYREDFEESLGLLQSQRLAKGNPALITEGHLNYMRDCRVIYKEVHEEEYSVAKVACHPPGELQNSVVSKYFNMRNNIQNLEELEEAKKEVKACLVLRRKMQVIVDLWLDINLEEAYAAEYKTTNRDYTGHLFQLEAMAFLYQLFTTGNAHCKGPIQRNILVHYRGILKTLDD